MIGLAQYTHPSATVNLTGTGNVYSGAAVTAMGSAFGVDVRMRCVDIHIVRSKTVDKSQHNLRTIRLPQISRCASTTLDNNKESYVSSGLVQESSIHKKTRKLVFLASEPAHVLYQLWLLGIEATLY